MGILLEADYKGVLQAKESVASGLRRAFSDTKAGSSRNPLERGEEEEEELKSAEHDGQITYELMNRDSGKQRKQSSPSPFSVPFSPGRLFAHATRPAGSTQANRCPPTNPTAITLASTTSSLSIPTFVYISAAAGTPILPTRYITTKRDAESTISSSFPTLRSIFIRPGFLYDNSRAFTMPIAFAGAAGHMANSLVGGRLTGLFGAAVEKPLKADAVAEAVVEAIDDGAVSGVVDTSRIEDLAGRGWRREML